MIARSRLSGFAILRRDGPVGHADSTGGGVRDPGQDIDLRGGGLLQGRRKLHGQRRLGHGFDAADSGLPLVPSQGNGAQAHGDLLGSSGRQRGLLYQPRAKAGGASVDGSRVPGKAEQGKRRRSAHHQRRWRPARLRSVQDHAQLHAVLSSWRIGPQYNGVRAYTVNYILRSDSPGSSQLDNTPSGEERPESIARTLMAIHRTTWLRTERGSS